MIAYFVILATSLLGFVGAAGWVIAAPVLLLTALRQLDHLRLAERYECVGELRVLLMAMGLTVLNSSIFEQGDTHVTVPLRAGGGVARVIEIGETKASHRGSNPRRMNVGDHILRRGIFPSAFLKCDPLTQPA